MATSNQDNDSKQGGKQGGKQSGDTSKRGFASMDPEQQREIASEGGRAAHEKGTAHEFTSEEARRAGSMSHKNDPGSRQSSSSTSRSGSGTGSQGGGKASRDEEEDENEQGGRGGSGGSKSGGSGSKT